MKTYIKYGFIFDPAQTWEKHYDFERDLAAFFKTHNMEAERVQTAEGQESINVLYITQVEDILPNTQQESVKTSMRKLNMASKDRDKKGRLIGRTRR